jgi:predicted transcriptional regulator
LKLTEKGTESRNCYEEKRMFIISEMLKDARKEAKITQEQLAEKQELKKSYISRMKTEKVIFNFRL